jgi:predicted DNA-binding protein (UPF0251 family)
MDTFDYTNEIWKTIPFAPDYMASDMGRVKRAKFSPFSRKNGVVLNAPLDKYGYKKAHVFVDGKQMYTTVHACVCAAFHGAKPTPVHQVAHSDGVRTNNIPSNLRWVTPQENAKDTIKHGSLKGEKNPAAKITRRDAEAMRLMRYFGISTRQLTDYFGVTETQVLRILKYQCWA